MGALAFEHHLLREAGTSPNNGALPLIVYRGAIDVGGGEPEAAVERHFDANGWGDGFRGDTFPFHHYHSIAHEVVGCARGGAQLQFGGPEGPVVDVQAGDAVLIPAGVVHCRLDDKPGYVSVGAYPPASSRTSACSRTRMPRSRTPGTIPRAWRSRSWATRRCPRSGPPSPRSRCRRPTRSRAAPAPWPICGWKAEGLTRLTARTRLKKVLGLRRRVVDFRDVLVERLQPRQHLRQRSAPERALDRAGQTSAFPASWRSRQSNTL